MSTPQTPASPPSQGAHSVTIKLNSGIQLTMPVGIISEFPDAKGFDVTINDDGRVLLTPIQFCPADAVRAELEARGITDDDIKDAIAWARGR